MNIVTSTFQPYFLLRYMQGINYAGWYFLSQVSLTFSNYVRTIISPLVFFVFLSAFDRFALNWSSYSFNCIERLVLLGFRGNCIPSTANTAQNPYCFVNHYSYISPPLPRRFFFGLQLSPHSAAAPLSYRKVMKTKQPFYFYGLLSAKNASYLAWGWMGWI